jgi:hypothetical protein
LDPKRQVQEVVPTEVVRWREHLTGGNLVVDVGQHVKNLAVVQHSGVWALTALDLLGWDLENYS